MNYSVSSSRAGLRRVGRVCIRVKLHIQTASAQQSTKAIAYESELVAFSSSIALWIPWRPSVIDPAGTDDRICDALCVLEMLETLEMVDVSSVSTARASVSNKRALCQRTAALARVDLDDELVALHAV